MKRPITLELRKRIVAACVAKKGTRQDVAKRFQVSLGMVKKLLQQQEETGDLRVRYRFCGRKAKLLPEYGSKLKALVAREPNLTLAELKERLGMTCTLPAIHQALARLGLTYRKRLALRQTKTGPKGQRRKAGVNVAKVVR